MIITTVAIHAALSGSADIGKPGSKEAHEVAEMFKDAPVEKIVEALYCAGRINWKPESRAYVLAFFKMVEKRDYPPREDDDNFIEGSE